MSEEKKTSPAEDKPGFFLRMRTRALALWDYCSEGVWSDHRNTLKVKVIKTINLTVRTFLSSDLQVKAYALTYQTLLAVVPTLALLFAIGRGFGFQNILETQLLTYFPSQHRALEMAFSFVDSCLAQASEGLFVGVGIVFLLWTIVSLLSNVEDTFNEVWGVTRPRSFLQKIIDYLAICIILPILMICSGGLQIFMSNTIQKLLPYDFLSPVLEFGLDFASVAFTWLFFAGAYMLIPNTRVQVGNALLSGVLAGTAFQILQWLFVHGQMGVARYNAIYGSFSFLPLMLLWMQFSWLITLAGALICRSAQNISFFSFDRQIRKISVEYFRKVTLAVLYLILKGFRDQSKPLDNSAISEETYIPIRLVQLVTERLMACGLIVHIVSDEGAMGRQELPFQPTMGVEHYTVAYVIDTLMNYGEKDFIPEFGKEFPQIMKQFDDLVELLDKSTSETLLVNL